MSDKKERYQDAALMIAIGMGFAWNGAMHTNGAMHQITDPDGRIFSLNFERYDHKGRIVINGSYPLSPSGYRFRTGHYPEITVSQTRTPAAIAADITRRFYPDFRQEWDYVIKRNAEEAAQIADANAITDRLNPHLKLRRSNHTTTPSTCPTFYSAYHRMGAIQIYTHNDESPPSVRIDRLSLTVEQAVQLAHILGEQPHE